MTDTGTAIEVVSHEMVAGRPHFAMTAAEAQGWAVTVRDMKRSVLVNGSDYMVLPGTSKPTLLKPGAEMLLLAAGLGFAITKVVDPSDVERGGVTYKCSVHRGSKDNVVAECEGYAGYDEDRFFKSAAENEAHERSNATKYNRAPNESKFAEYRAPWNSVIKMAQKRALVGAALNACAASGLFTQDLEDERNLPPLWDATVVVQPHVDALTPEQKVELRAWWMLPSLAKLTAEQGALVLIQIGRITAEPVPASPAVAPAPSSGDPEMDAYLAEMKPEPTAPPQPSAAPEGTQSSRARRPPPPVPSQAPVAASSVVPPAQATLTAEVATMVEGPPRVVVDGITIRDEWILGKHPEAFAEQAAFDKAWETAARKMQARDIWLHRNDPKPDGPGFGPDPEEEA